MTDHELKVIKIMEIYGGSFIKSLAQCFLTADSDNFQKLRTSFRNEWMKYERFLEFHKVKE